MNLPEDLYTGLDQGEIVTEGISTLTDQKSNPETLCYPPSNNSSKRPEISVIAALQKFLTYLQGPFMHIFSGMMIKVADWCQIMLQILGP